MRRNSVIGVVLLTLASVIGAGDCLADLIPQSQANRIGLERKWNAQATMTGSQSTLKQILLDRNTVFSLTDTGQLQAFDAQTGASLWTVQVGRRDLPTTEMDACKNYVATINGSTVYVYNRFNGKLLWTGEPDVAIGGGPAISESRVYIPGFRGRVQSYALRLITDSLKEFGKDEKTLSPEEQEQLEVERRDSLRIDDQFVEPLNCQSVGKIFRQPIVTRDDVKENIDCIAWTTDNGSLYLGSIRTNSPDGFPIKFFVETGKDISSRPTVIPWERDKADETGRIYLASRDGYVYCVRELDGEQLWEYPCNDPIVEHVAAISCQIEDAKTKKTKIIRSVYAPTYQRGMFCLDAVTGEKKWQTPGIKRFLSQSNNRVYTVDYKNNLTVLNAETGLVLGSMPLGNNRVQMLNEITDRIYLASDTGMIQCLRQMDVDKPIYHQQNPEKPKEREIMIGDDDSKSDNGDDATPFEEAAEGDDSGAFGDSSSDEKADSGDEAGVKDDAGGSDDSEPAPDGGGDAPAEGEDPFGSGGDGADPFA